MAEMFIDQPSWGDLSTTGPLVSRSVSTSGGVEEGGVQTLVGVDGVPSRALKEQAVQTEPILTPPGDPTDSTLGPAPPLDSEKSLPSPPSTNDSEPGRKNIVFFGETGVGKSSVINMFREGTDHWYPGSEVPISSGAVGCTFSSKGYEADVDEERYMLWDTAGLNEGARGTVTHRDSVESLAMLLHNLGGKVHLLVYCIRGKRFRQVIKDNYELFYQRFCNSQVPIVVVVTGLENEEPNMDSWWAKNERDFQRYGLRFDDYACVTATRGKAVKDGYMFDEEYEESQKKVRALIVKSCSAAGCTVSDSINSGFEMVEGSRMAGNGRPLIHGDGRRERSAFSGALDFAKRHFNTTVTLSTA